MLHRCGAVVVACVLGLGCATGGAAPESTAGWHGPVQVRGSFRGMFHEGKTSASVTLDMLLPNEHLYGVGALADLAGEVTVVGGKAYLSYPEGPDTARMEEPTETDAGATLFVSTEVADWVTVTTTQAITFDELDVEVGRLAASAGMNIQARFPFLIEGQVEDLQWHVIDGKRIPPGSTSHRDHMAAAVQMKRAKIPATLIGFYSVGDQGVFTFRGKRTHIHCVFQEQLATGHVDHVNIPKGTAVMFPKGGS